MNYNKLLKSAQLTATLDTAISLCFMGVLPNLRMDTIYNKSRK